MLSTSHRVSRILGPNRHQTRSSASQEVTKGYRKYKTSQEPGLGGNTGQEQPITKKRFANRPNEAPPEVEVSPMVKTWVQSRTVFASEANNSLSCRKMGTLERSLANLANYGLPTATVRLYRLKIFLNDDTMFQVLEVIQKMRPELWGTIPRQFEGDPAYVDTFEIGFQSEEVEEEPDTSERDEISEEMSKLKQPKTVPKTLVPIPLEVIEGGDIKTYLSEITTMTNVPFEEGAPLARVRIVRHNGGSDLLVAGHQALFDDESFSEFCLQILEIYDIASEGRLKSTGEQQGNMLADVDAMYHKSFHDAIRIGFQSHLSRLLKRLGSSTSWKRLPFITEIPNASSSFSFGSTPPSPLLNASNVMFGRLDAKQSQKLGKQCTKHGVSVQATITAAALLSAASIIHQGPHSIKSTRSHPGAGEEPDPLSPERVKVKSKKKQKNAHPQIESSKNEPSFLEKLFGRSKNSADKGTESEIIPIVAMQNFSIRQYFDPSIAPLIIGNLTTNLLTPTNVPVDANLWETAVDVKEMRETSNFDSSVFRDIHFMPNIAKLCASDSDWQHPSVPSIIISDTTNNPMPTEMRERFAIFDSKTVTSCWIPGVHVSSHYDQGELQISVSYRRPLIPDTVAHNMLTSILNKLSL